MHHEIKAALRRIKDAESTYRFAARHVILQCDHSVLLEVDSTPHPYGGIDPPMRVCENCGLAETGWGIGWRILRGPAKPATRDEFYAARTAHVFEADKADAEQHLPTWLITKSFLKEARDADA